MRKQILGVMLGLSVVLSGCSSQSTESMLQEVKKDAKEVKSGKATMMLSSIKENNNSSRNLGFEISGDEKFEPLEFAMKGKYISNIYGETKDESYLKDGVYYLKTYDYWFKKKGPTDNRHAYNFKVQSMNMRDDILNLLDNKDNWDISKDGDKVTFKLKKTDELKNKVKEIHNKELKKDLKYSEFEYTVEYVYNTKNKKLDKLFYEIVAATDSSPLRVTTRGTLEDLNKEIKIELPEESKEAKELKEKKE